MLPQFYSINTNVTRPDASRLGNMRENGNANLDQHSRIRNVDCNVIFEISRDESFGSLGDCKVDQVANLDRTFKGSFFTLLYTMIGYYTQRMYALAEKRGFDIYTEKRQMESYDGALFRGVIFYYLQTLTPLSSREIGIMFRVNGSNVLYWTRKVKSYISIQDRQTMKLLDELKPYDYEFAKS